MKLLTQIDNRNILDNIVVIILLKDVCPIVNLLLDECSYQTHIHLQHFYYIDSYLITSIYSEAYCVSYLLLSYGAVSKCYFHTQR